MSRPEPVLLSEGLKVELGGVPVLNIPSFQLFEKEVVTIVGPNGSGKTTFLLALAGLLKPTAGCISHRKERLQSRDSILRYRRRISMVFQEPLLFDTTVFKNVVSGLRMRGFSKPGSKEQAIKYLESFHCGHLAGRSARKLSGGEAQRTSLARAFAVEPEIIFLDEPFSSLDPPARAALNRDLLTMVKETGVTAVMVTHLESEALNMSGRVVAMNGGQIVQTGTPLSIMKHPANEFIARLVGMENILTGRVRSCSEGALTASVCGHEIRAKGHAAKNKEVTCCIRPEHVAVHAGENGELRHKANVFAGRILQFYSTNSFLKLHLDCGFPITSILPMEAFSALDPSEGKEVYVSFSPEAVHILEKI